MQNSERAGSGHRRYQRVVLRKIAFIVFAQRIGMTLDEVAAELAKLPEGRVPEGKDWAKLSGGWTGRLDERIAELQRLRAGLTECIGCGCLSLERCQVRQRRRSRRSLRPGAALLGQRPSSLESLVIESLHRRGDKLCGLWRAEFTAETAGTRNATGEDKRQGNYGVMAEPE